MRQVAKGKRHAQRSKKPVLVTGFLFLHVPATNARDARHGARHTGDMIRTEYGLHFVKDGDHWRCMEHPELVMLRGRRYRVGERTFGSLDEALRRLEARGSTQDQ